MTTEAQTPELIPSTIKEIKNACRKMFYSKNTRNISPNIVGPPGIGKTDLLSQLATEWGATYKAFLTSTMDPTDVVGVPHEKDGITYFCPPADWIALTEDCHKLGIDPNTPMVAALEDVTHCSPQVLAALMRVLCNGEIAGSRIRDNVLLGATGNRVGDAAGAIQMPSALANRFMHFEVKASSEEWIEWAGKNKVNAYILSFVEKVGIRALHNHEATAHYLAYPTPRSVMNASYILDAMKMESEKNINLALTGLCGSAWAREFLVFYKVREKVIPVKTILDNPETAPIPDSCEIDIMYSTLNNLILEVHGNFNVKDAISALTYVVRIDTEEIQMFSLKKLQRMIYENNGIEQEDRDKINAAPVWKKVTDLLGLSKAVK